MAKLGSHAGRKRTAAVDTPMILRIREIIGARGIAGPVVGRGGLGIDKGGRLFGMSKKSYYSSGGRILEEPTWGKFFSELGGVLLLLAGGLVVTVVGSVLLGTW